MVGVTATSSSIIVIGVETEIKVAPQDNPTIRCRFLAVITKKTTRSCGWFVEIPSYLVNEEIVIERVLMLKTITFSFVRVDLFLATSYFRGDLDPTSKVHAGRACNHEISLIFRSQVMGRTSTKASTLVVFRQPS